MKNTNCMEPKSQHMQTGQWFYPPCSLETG